MVSSAAIEDNKTDIKSAIIKKPRCPKQSALPSHSMAKVAKKRSAPATKDTITDDTQYSAHELEMETKLSDYFQMNCDLCMHRFGSWSDARSHYLDRHNVLKPFLRCCNRKYFLRSRIIEHIIWHAEPDSFWYEKQFFCFFCFVYLYRVSIVTAVKNVQRNFSKNEPWLHTCYAIWKMKNDNLSAINAVNDSQDNTF